MQAEVVSQTCRIIEQAETPPKLSELAAATGFSQGHLHRLFKARTGLTPRQYAAAHRARRMRDGLAKGASVTTAIHDAGFGSSGRFYEQWEALLGMSPSHYRAGGVGEAIRFAIGQSSLGAILVASSVRGVVAILMGDDPGALAQDLQDRFPNAQLIGGDVDYERVVAAVVGLVETPSLGTNLPLDVRGTAFQQRVWNALREIHAGETATYAQIAGRIGAPGASRAVAAACAANAIAVAIPCHRVIRSDGALSGYRWGVERKQLLLRREQKDRSPGNKS